MMHVEAKLESREVSSEGSLEDCASSHSGEVGEASVFSPPSATGMLEPLSATLKKKADHNIGEDDKFQDDPTLPIEERVSPDQVTLFNQY